MLLTEAHDGINGVCFIARSVIQHALLGACSMMTKLFCRQKGLFTLNVLMNLRHPQKYFELTFVV